MEEPESSGDYGGGDIINWLSGSEARAVARGLAARLGLAGSNFDSSELLADALYAVLNRTQSDRPLAVTNPAAYGTTVIKHLIYAAARGRKDEIELMQALIDEPTDRPRGSTGATDLEDEVLRRVAPSVDHEVDTDMRELIEARPGPTPWATSAALTYLTLAAYPCTYPDGVPRPKTRATPDQKRCWAALWFAGQQDLFDADRAGDAQRRKRQRYIADVLEYVQHTYGRYRLENPR